MLAMPRYEIEKVYIGRVSLESVASDFLDHVLDFSAKKAIEKGLQWECNHPNPAFAGEVLAQGGNECSVIQWSQEVAAVIKSNATKGAYAND